MHTAETHPSPGRMSMRFIFWVPIAISLAGVLAALTGLVAMSWRSLDRLQPVQRHLVHIALIQDVGLQMEQALLKGLRGVRVSRAELDKMHDTLFEIAAMEEAMHPETRGRLQHIADLIAQPGRDSIELLFETLAQIRVVLNAERAHHEALLGDITASNRVELRLAVVLLVVLPLGGGLAMILLRRWVAQPLRDLQDLLNRLSERDYRPVPEAVLDDTGRLARPAFSSYNALVSRLQELEIEHQDREQLLEARVRKATEALLAQSRELARAERLAAVGAVSAGLAHELRNPLAGIQLACSKLQQQLGESEHAARISAVIAELKRVNHLLTEQVDAARHAPEPMTEVDIGTAVDELLALLRYQIPPGIRLETRIEPGLQCALPAAGLRQALLNLVLNSVQILGETGHVFVTAEHREDRLAISIADDGPGFPAEMLRAGVRPFATGRAGGTGLGLAMVRRFVRDLDGELALANLEPHGAQVSLLLWCRAVKRMEGETYA